MTEELLQKYIEVLNDDIESTTAMQPPINSYMAGLLEGLCTAKRHLLELTEENE